MFHRIRRVLSVMCLSLLCCAYARAGTVDNPILFVTQVPVPGDFTTIGSTFGNHQGTLNSAFRGGDLYIRYPDGTLKNLTAAAGFGMSGQQGLNAIAVREPSVHWSGTKALFSMVVGAPTKQFEVKSYYWQIYEITGLGPNDTPVITKVPKQPVDYNNVSPIYGTDERIIFTSDRTRSGERHLYPQLDEYEEAPTVSGLWSLDPVSGELFIMSHNPSGNFTPTLDSFGRVIFTRWDHMQRDQQADDDNAGGTTYGTFNYTDESLSSAPIFGNRTEVFPEPRVQPAGSTLERHTFNHFFPWQIHEDGTEEETLNHIGRHELHSYFNRSFNDDPNLREFTTAIPRTNPNSILNFFQIKEDAANPGTYFGIDAPEFSTHASGQIISINGAPSVNTDAMKITYITHRDTAGFTDDGETPTAGNSGHYRNPLPMANGTLVAVHTPETRADNNEGTRANPVSRYNFRLKTLKLENGVYVPDQLLTAGISKTVSWFDPDVLVTYTGELWELDPVEVRARPKPARLTAALGSSEAQVFAEEGVDVEAFKAFLKQKNLAVVVSRDATTRDFNDQQQPFNLQVPNTAVKSIGKPGKVYDVSHLQFFQADQLRGLGLQTAGDTPRQGRRVIAQEMHDPSVVNPPVGTAPKGSVAIAADGSTAAFVPARRAMTWQLTDPAGGGVVRERYWLTFQPGEIRSCTSCHGLNTKDQASRTTPQNKPEALRKLLQFYKDGGVDAGPGGGGGSGGGNTGDSDGDGFPNDLEGLLGTSPNDPASTPFGGAPAGTPQALTLTKASVKLDFAKDGRDQISLLGTLPVPDGFSAAGQKVDVLFGGVAASFTLSDKGQSPRANNAFKLLLKRKKNVVSAQTARFMASLKSGTFRTQLADEQLDGSADMKGATRAVNVIVLFNQGFYQATQSLSYSARQGKTGSAKMPR